MADSDIVHYSGQWIQNDGVAAGGAKLYVYLEDTTTLASIYSDRDLSQSLANPVTADADGLMPFAYIGTVPYKARLETSAGALIDEEDDLPGALDTSPFTSSDFASPQTEFDSETSDRTIVAADLGTVINCNVTGGTLQITMMSAVTAGNGKGVTIRHVGTANYVKIVTVSSQTITRSSTGVTTTAFALRGYGESVTIVSDGANWHITSYVPPLITATTGVIVIKDRVSSAPVSPNAGDRFIVSSAFSTFEQEDIIEEDGQGSYIEYTPPTDCGWIAFVQDENAYYGFQGSAWVELFPAASDTVAGILEIAIQSEMETGTSTTLAVVPGRQHFHPAHPKFWAVVTVTGGTPALTTSHNVSSVTDTAQGRLTVTINTDFSSADWSCHLSGLFTGGLSNTGSYSVRDQAAGTCEVELRTGTDGGTLSDPNKWFVAGLGDLS